MAAAAKLLQSCPTLWDPIDGSPPGSPVPGILQARTLEWIAVSFSNAWKWKVKVKSLGCVWLLVSPWTAAHQAPPSMGFSRQEYWSGVPLSSPVFNGGEGLKKTNKGPEVLWNRNNGAGRVTTPAPEGARGRSLWAFCLRDFDLESDQLGPGERTSKQALPTQVLAGRDPGINTAHCLALLFTGGRQWRGSGEPSWRRTYKQSLRARVGWTSVQSEWARAN